MEQKELIKQDTPQDEVSAAILKPGETVEDRIGIEIAKFDTNKEKIAELAKLYTGLQIFAHPGADAPKEAIKAYNDSYEQVEKARSVVRKIRTTMETKRKEVVAPYIKVKESVDEYCKDRTKEVVEIEGPLADQLKKADEAEIKIKKAAEEAEKKLLEDRMNTLKASGIVFDGFFFSIGEISVDTQTVKSMTDEKFNMLNSRVIELDQRIKAAEEAEKQRKDQEAAELQKREEELEREKKELLQARTDMRKGQLINAGMQFAEEANAYKYSVISINVRQIESLPNDDWKEELSRNLQHIQELKDSEKEHEERVQRIGSRTENLRAIGLEKDPVRKCYLFLRKAGEISVPYDVIDTYTNEEWLNLVNLTKEEIASIETKDAERIEREQKEEKRYHDRIERLVSLGMKKNDDKYSYEFVGVHIKCGCSIFIDRIKVMPDDDFEKIYNVSEKAIEECKRRELEEGERLQKESEKERQEKLSDIDKGIEYFTALLQIVPPVIVSDETLTKRINNTTDLFKAALAYLNATNELI